MKRVAGGIALAATLFALAPMAPANDAAAKDGKSEAERRLEEVMAELDAQRLQILDLKARIQAPAEGSVDDAVKKYLESEEGKKALGRGPSDFKASWKDGLTFETGDKAFTLKVGGRAMYDFVMPDADDEVEAAVGDFDPQQGFRRLRVEMSGTIHESIYFINSLDFAGAALAYKDNYIGYKGIPLIGHAQVGYMKEPVGLEEMTSSKSITFMERSLANNAFAPAHNNGFMIFNSVLDDRLNWFLGDFSDNAAGGPGNVQMTHNISARIVGTPIFDKEKNLLLHVGLSAQDRNPESENDRFRVRPGIPFLPRTQDTGTISVEKERILGLETAFVMGPLSLQGEYYQAAVSDHPDAPGASPDFTGYYVQASYWVTGESRAYKNGCFGRVKPKNDFTSKGGTGAVELAVRLDSLDLEDDGVTGGEGDAITVGINWHLNANARIMLNYVMYDVENGALDGSVNSLALRFQIEF